MIDRQLDGLVLGQDPANLSDPRVQGRLSPKVVYPEEAPFQQVLAQPVYLFRGEARRAGIGSEKEGTAEERRIAGGNHGVSGIPRAVPCHARFRQLGETNH